MSPRRSSGRSSPRRRSPRRSIMEVPSSITELMSMLDYEPDTDDVLESVIEREWRLLAVMLNRREEDDQRAMLAQQYHKLWDLEKQQRKMEEEEAYKHHKRYLQRKNLQERTSYEYRQLEKVAESQIHKRNLLDSIKHKEEKTAEFLASEQYKKEFELAEKALEDRARQLLAYDKRTRHSAAQEWRKRIEMVDTLRRVDDARQRRRGMLKDTSQRVAFESALSLWASTLLRQEVAASDCARRAQHAWHAALTHARGQRVLRARQAQERRTRDVTQLCAQLRDAVRSRPLRDRSI